MNNILYLYWFHKHNSVLGIMLPGLHNMCYPGYASSGKLWKDYLTTEVG